MVVSLSHTLSGNGPALVLLHPVGLDKTFWGPLPERAGASHTVVAVDLAGHGGSDAAPLGRDVVAYAEDVRALLDSLGIERATVLGLSFGGMIAQELALLAPNRIERLVVGACGARLPEAVREAVRARGADAMPTGMAAVVETTLARWFTPDYLGSPDVERVRQRLLTDSPQGWAAGWHAISTFDAAARLGQLRMPVLAVAGELDAGTAVPATRAIAEAIGGAEFAMIEGAPHMMQIECADRFTAIVLAFLARNSGAHS